jgi:hypothetical protein
MSDKTGTFLLKPVLLSSDLDYVRGKMKRNEPLETSGLDHTEAVHGYFNATAECGRVLGLLFWRANGRAIVFLYQRLSSLGDWRWLRGFELGDDQDGPDFHEAVQEMHGLVIAEEDLCQTK